METKKEGGNSNDNQGFKEAVGDGFQANYLAGHENQDNLTQSSPLPN
jgi:hypothetical protein